MADPYVSPVNVLTDLDGRTVVVGVDYDAVTIHVGSFEPGGGIRLSPPQLEGLMAALAGARSDAAEQMRQKAEEEAADEEDEEYE